MQESASSSGQCDGRWNWQSYAEGLATRGDPESRVGAREGDGEALTGARAGRAIEPRNHRVRGAGVVYGSEGQHCQRRYRDLLVDPARSENHCMFVTALRENREISCSPVW